MVSSFFLVFLISYYAVWVIPKARVDGGRVWKLGSEREAPSDYAPSGVSSVAALPVVLLRSELLVCRGGCSYCYS
jgi:hypothetical protein